MELHGTAFEYFYMSDGPFQPKTLDTPQPCSKKHDRSRCRFTWGSSHVSTVVSKAVHMFYGTIQTCLLSWLLRWPPSLSLHSFHFSGVELIKATIFPYLLFSISPVVVFQTAVQIWLYLNYYQQVFRVEQKFGLHIWMDVINIYFSIMFQPFLTFLNVTAKSSADFDPSVVLFDDKCKWLILKWVWLKSSKAIHCVLDSLIRLGSITDFTYVYKMVADICRNKFESLWSWEEKCLEFNMSWSAYR